MNWVPQQCCIFVQNITKAGFHCKPLIFFFFVTWISFIIFWILVGIHENVGRKNWNFGGIHEMQKKINWTHLVPRLGPRTSAPASAPALGPSLGTRWFQFILFLHFMKPPKFQFFCQHFRETTQNSKNNKWNQVTKKKNEWFPIKTLILVIFDLIFAVKPPKFLKNLKIALKKIWNLRWFQWNPSNGFKGFKKTTFF